MSDTLVKQLNAITRVSLCDPMNISMDNWNAVLDNVTKVIGELEQAQTRVTELEELIRELRQKSRRVRNYSNPDDVFDAVPVRALLDQEKNNGE